MATTLEHVLDDPIRASLYGAHARFRLGDGAIVRYQPAVARFIGNPRNLSAADFQAAPYRRRECDIAAATHFGAQSH